MWLGPPALLLLPVLTESQGGATLEPSAAGWQCASCNPQVTSPPWGGAELHCSLRLLKIRRKCSPLKEAPSGPQVFRLKPGVADAPTLHLQPQLLAGKVSWGPSLPHPPAAPLPMPQPMQQPGLSNALERPPAGLGCLGLSFGQNWNYLLTWVHKSFPGWEAASVGLG